MSETPTDETAPAPDRRGSVWHVVRWVASMLACVLAAGAVTGAVAAYYARSQLLDTEQFTQRTLVIAADPAVKDRVSALVMGKIDEALNVDDLSAAADAWVGGQDAPDEVQMLIESAALSLRGFIENEVNEFIHSPLYLTVWDTAVTEAHSSLVSALRGADSGSLTAEGTTLTLDLGRVVALVKQRLLEAGFALAADIPAVEAEFVLLNSEQVLELQRDTERLEWAATWLPWIALALLVIGIALAPRRWTAVLVLGGLSALLAGAALLAIREGRAEFVQRAADLAIAPLIYNVFADDLRTTYQAMFAIAALTAVLAIVMLAATRSRSAD